MNLLLVMNESKSHYVYIKDFDRFMFHKTKNKNEKYFCKSCLQCFRSKNVLTEHKEICLSINGAQSVRFKVYTVFECNLNSVKSDKGSYSKKKEKKNQDYLPCSFAYKLVCFDDRFSKPIVVFRGKNSALKFIQAALEEYEYCKKVMKKHFNKKFDNDWRRRTISIE